MHGVVRSEEFSLIAVAPIDTYTYYNQRMQRHNNKETWFSDGRFSMGRIRSAVCGGVRFEQSLPGLGIVVLS